MTFQQLRSFCMVVECENVTKASKALYITQPALSMMLRKIETELGVALFDRGKRNISLNENGKMFYHFARKTLDEFDAVLSKLNMTKQDESLLRFCYSSAYMSDYVLPAFSADNPEISIAISEVKEELIPYLLESEVFDIAISGARHDQPGSVQLISVPFAVNQLLVSVPKDNSLALRENLSLKDLQGQNFIRLSKRGEFSDAVNEEAEREGISMAVTQRVNYEVIKALQKNMSFLYFVTLLQAQFDYVPENRRLIPVRGEVFTKDMYATFLRKNEKKARPYISWASTHLIRSVEELIALHRSLGY